MVYLLAIANCVSCSPVSINSNFFIIIWIQYGVATSCLRTSRGHRAQCKDIAESQLSVTTQTRAIIDMGDLTGLLNETICTRPLCRAQLSLQFHSQSVNRPIHQDWISTLILELPPPENCVFVY